MSRPPCLCRTSARFFGNAVSSRWPSGFSIAVSDLNCRLGPHAPAVADSLDQLALSLIQLDRFEEAERHLLESKRIRSAQRSSHPWPSPGRWNWSPYCTAHRVTMSQPYLQSIGQWRSAAERLEITPTWCLRCKCVATSCSSQGTRLGRSRPGSLRSCSLNTPFGVITRR